VSHSDFEIISGRCDNGEENDSYEKPSCQCLSPFPNDGPRAPTIPSLYPRSSLQTAMTRKPFPPRQIGRLSIREIKKGAGLWVRRLWGDLGSAYFLACA